MLAQSRIYEREREIFYSKRHNLLEIRGQIQVVKTEKSMFKGRDNIWKIIEVIRNPSIISKLKILGYSLRRDNPSCMMLWLYRCNGPARCILNAAMSLLSITSTTGSTPAVVIERSIIWEDLDGKIIRTGIVWKCYEHRASYELSGWRIAAKANVEKVWARQM